ncbi:MAG TPA: carbohydrate ABC transporter permease [Kiritimatiellia bacterium]|nr:carbohydrate ABC transporter permease [Kiritimatiellia bacterium]
MKGNDSVEAVSRPLRGTRSGERVYAVARGLAIYALLIAGSAVFALPFIWMIGSSFKVDREMFGDRITLMPGRPVPALKSPYLDTAYFKTGNNPVYRDLHPFLLSLPALQNSPDPEALAPGVFKRLEQTLPRAAWSASPEDLRAAISNAVDATLVAEVTRQIQRHLAFGSVRVRSFDVQEDEVTVGRPISEFWSIRRRDLQIASSPHLVDRADTVPAADLVYDFTAPGRQEIVLERTIDLPFPANRLFRIQISLTPDDSWHAIEFFVEKNGVRYQGMRPEYTGRFQPQVVTLQEFGPADAADSSRIRLWIPYREIARGPEFESRPDKVKVTMVLRESSQAVAWWAKCSRNYRNVLSYIPFWRYAGTSLLLVILNILGTVFSCSIVAYAFARLQWPGRTLSFGVMLATMMIPPQVTMIPYFLIMKSLGWYNTLSPLWITSCCANAFNVFLLRQFMKGIPRDMEDAAKIDGCSFLQIYWYVIMPLIKPTLACIAIFTFMGVWNDFMGPLVFLSDQRLYPLSLGLYALNVQQGGDFGMMMAGSLLMTLPVIVIFFFAQKYFIQGITLTGMKG